MTVNTRELTQWQVAAQPFKLECTEEVIEQLRRWTLTGDLPTLDRGVLWGRREGSSVHVMEASRARAATPGERHIRVGWFQIRLGADIRLTTEDLLYHDEHFREPGGIALILRPASAGSIRVGVFFRELNGDIRSVSSYQEVVLTGHVDTGAPVIQTKERAQLGKAEAPAAGKRRAILGVAFLMGVLAAIVPFAAWRHAAVSPSPPVRVNSPVAASLASTPSDEAAILEKTRTLADQNRRLQAELEALKIHKRRLEATLTILRDR